MKVFKVCHSPEVPIIIFTAYINLCKSIEGVSSEIAAASYAHCGGGLLHETGEEKLRLGLLSPPSKTFKSNLCCYQQLISMPINSRGGFSVLSLLLINRKKLSGQEAARGGTRHQPGWRKIPNHIKTFFKLPLYSI